MSQENPIKNLLFLAGAGVLVLLGILILFNIFVVAVKLVTALLPWILIGGGIYLGYRWLKSNRR